MSSTPSEYITVAEAADLLRVSIPTIRRWIRTGSITAHRAGQRRLLLRRADVIGAMRTVDPTANETIRGITPVAPWSDRDDTGRMAVAEREPQRGALEDATVLEEQMAADQGTSGIMAPETWEQIREGRELRTEQIMNEIDPEFDEFNLGEVAHMIVHSPDRPGRRRMTLEEQRQWFAALDRAQQTSDRIRKRSGVDTFPPSEDIIAELRAERIRQLTGDSDPPERHDG